MGVAHLGAGRGTQAIYLTAGGSGEAVTVGERQDMDAAHELDQEP